MTDALASIAELVRRETGVVLPVHRRPALEAALRRVAPDLGPAAFLRATSVPAVGRDLLARLIDEVTTQETFFIRDIGQLETIEWQQLLRGAREAGSGVIRVWSAACATGEEPYTLALLAAEAFAPERPPVDILGTDISSAALAAAGAGRYRARAVSALAEPLRGRYLDEQGDGSYLVGGLLRGVVRFRRHNLARDSMPPSGEAAFDLIACRNVLIYFQRPLAERVIEALERSLRSGGKLMLGAADALQRPRHRTAVRQSAGAARPSGSPAGRPPRGPNPVRKRQQQLAAAIDEAGDGDRAAAQSRVAALLADDPLDPEAHFMQGFLALEAGNPLEGSVALRRAAYLDPSFALALFALGRAYDALGDGPAARRAYQRVLRTLDPEDHRHEQILRQVDMGDIAAACRARLRGRQ